MNNRVPITELKTGMYICGLEKKGAEPLFLMNSILLRTAADIDHLYSRDYDYAYVEVAEDPKPVPQKTPAPLAAAQTQELENEPEAFTPDPDLSIEFPAHDEEEDDEIAVEETDFFDELKEAKSLRNEAEELVRGFLRNARLSGEIDTKAVDSTVGRMVESLFRNPDALTSLTRLKSFDDYTFSHCVNVSILSLAIGRHMGLKKNEIKDLGIGAILHDIGKMLVPESILKKPAKLTEDEFSVMRTHASLGDDLLSQSSEISIAARQVALHHHERFDGTGYPAGLAGEEIPVFARIGAVADIYDAMSSNRVYQKGVAPEEALRKLYLMRGTHLDPSIVERLIKCLGIYPIGTLVELNTYEKAIVRSLNPANPLKPTVLMVSDRHNRMLNLPFVLSLSDDQSRWITSSKDPENHGGIQDLNLI